MAKKREFVRQPVKWGLYKWSPDTKNPQKEKGLGQQNLLNKKGKKFCNAKPGTTKTEDWFTGYVYKQVIDNKGVKHRYAYVECGYVE